MTRCIRNQNGVVYQVTNVLCATGREPAGRAQWLETLIRLEMRVERAGIIGGLGELDEDKIDKKTRSLGIGDFDVLG